MRRYRIESGCEHGAASNERHRSSTLGSIICGKSGKWNDDGHGKKRTYVLSIGYVTSQHCRDESLGTFSESANYKVSLNRRLNT